MARATTRSWIQLVAGLVVGAQRSRSSRPSCPWRFPAARCSPIRFQAGRRRLTKRLSNAIEAYRHGDYESAAVLFQDVLKRQADLTEPDKKEFSRLWQANATALQARKNGHTQLNLVERAPARKTQFRGERYSQEAHSQ